MWSLSNASSSHSQRARYEQRAYGTGCRIRPGLQGIWTRTRCCETSLFPFPPEQALCILGRSGTGKSVTLKLLIALLKPDRGSIWVDGNDVTRLKPSGLSKVRRKMGFLFQDAALFDSLTLYENLALPLARLTTKTQAEIDFAINDVLRKVELAERPGQTTVRLVGRNAKTSGACKGARARTESASGRRAE